MKNDPSFPLWWALAVSAAGVAIAFFEAFQNYTNWPVSGLAYSMIFGGIPAWMVDEYIRRRGSK